MTELIARQNPYVGPRTFTLGDRDRYFGREQEAEALLARVISQRVVLFHAQSGAGKSSLINTRLAPDLRESGFAVLPIGRVGGNLPAGLGDEEIDNIYVFNLMLHLDREQADPALFARLTLSQFLSGLISEDGESWRYDPQAVTAEQSSEFGDSGADPLETIDYETRPYILIVDQFEEIVTAHPHHWSERRGFFQQLNQAMREDHNLWVVFTLREDYVAALEPFAEYMDDRLRSRFYMQRMSAEAAVEAVAKPAAQSGRPYAEGVAELLVDNLRQIRFHADESGARLGQYVEPVQMQVVCFQLWENLAQDEGSGSQDGGAREISQKDLARAGDVDSALAAFYEDAIQTVLANSDHSVSERQLRTWFDENLITEAATRGSIYRGEQSTMGMPNAIVDLLQSRFLLRTELRSGSAWIELVHDRFIGPIVRSNTEWAAHYQNPLTTAAQEWIDSGRDSAKLLHDDALITAREFADQNPYDVTELEREVLEESERYELTIREEERRQRRQRRLFAAIAIALIALFALLSWYGLSSANRADRQAQLAEAARGTAVAQEAVAMAAQATAEANSELANQQLEQLAVEQKVAEARALAVQGDALGAVAAYSEAEAARPGLSLEAEKDDALRIAANQHVQNAERLMGEALVLDTSDEYWRLVDEAEAEFRKALALDSPADTPVYVWIDPGGFIMGSTDLDPLAFDEEKPAHSVDLDGYWIMRTEVTNAQYKRCVDAGVCTEPTNKRWLSAQFASQPVTNVDWFQASTYAEWVGGRLPTEAEWERACRGDDGRIYPWGNEPPSDELVNYFDSGLGSPTNVGTYPAGANGLYDMSGNAWEWTADIFDGGYYAISPRENPSGPEGGDFQSLRSGAYTRDEVYVRCAARNFFDPGVQSENLGFRVVIAPYSPE